MTDDERRVLAEARTDCIVAVAYLQGANDRGQALEMMGKVLTRLNTAFGLEYADQVQPRPAPARKADTGAGTLL